MFVRLLNLIFGSKNDRELKALQPLVAQINEMEPPLQNLSLEALADKTQTFKKRIEAGETVDDILPEAFAVCREASRRILGMRHFDVQLLGGMVLNQGKISEMKTGEGKTLMATLPVYLNSLTGKGVHLVTVNDYLAKRDAQWMGAVYHSLGCSVGVIQHESSFLYDPHYEAADKRLNNLRPCTRPEAYRADITYGTNNEFGFDYLRDNLVVTDLRQRVQRELHYAIVDEVDSILIDEARTPLIISGPTEQNTDLYNQINRIIPQLKPEEDYTIEEKSKTATLTEEGNAKVEKLLGVDNLYDMRNLNLVHHVVKALSAHAIYKRDVDYVVKDGEVQIVDEFTGRLMPGRRWGDGLHQAVEAKEGVKIANENQTLASVTFQNFFRMYEKLAGMTGTADTEAAEFAKIYNLDVNVIPTNRPMIRIDHPDVVYRTEKEKFTAIAEEIKEYHERGQPVLVGTISIEKSERLSAMLKHQGVKHHVLNAKFHEKEAEIIALAGQKGAVTLATNMAGRGTDIVLGGSPEALYKQQVVYRGEDLTDEQKQAAFEKIKVQCEKEKEEVLTLGGLHIVGTERHESRRIDNQLRGRAGRQGDPGSTRFFLSLQDDLMRIFASERVSNLMLKLGMEEGVPIEHGMVTKSIENAQKKVEAHNFEIRKQLLEYDDVMNKQREIIYAHRGAVLSGSSLEEDVRDWMEDVVDSLLATHCPEEEYAEAWNLEGLRDVVHGQCGAELITVDEMKDMGRDGLREELLERMRALFEQRQKERDQHIGPEVRHQLERALVLQVIDHHWKEHLLGMDQLRDGIGLRGYGQKDPLAEYKREGYDMFSGMMDLIKSDALERLFKVQVVQGEKPQEVKEVDQPRQMSFNRGEAAAPKTVHRAEDKVGRNDPCPCGSGKKYKKCHGA
ncbi:preprotein translocase subunit SecA [Candidatus Nitronereus thalassa]|uniref:Protein translocase subunit SecA n=1 Tax=Candidatus Nitronereus thalassa TaxID=3020898 RepID=A0ABU3KBV3_9BACT|nr:preprotein translocase subunit SecA [Candidatus Nitronereus thalassa]MDT7043911.1 preprotein translocase subunit SecA [Candidatus Nitronereus thalassa]